MKITILSHKKYTMEGFEEEVRRILLMMMAETCREFEKLPIIKYGDILRNILYSGVWCRFEEVSKSAGENGRKSMLDPYSVLGVSRNATDEEIKRHTEN